MTAQSLFALCFFFPERIQEHAFNTIKDRICKIIECIFILLNLQIKVHSVVFQPDLAINAKPNFWVSVWTINTVIKRYINRERASDCQYFLFFFFLEYSLIIVYQDGNPGWLRTDVTLKASPNYPRIFFHTQCHGSLNDNNVLRRSSP